MSCAVTRMRLPAFRTLPSRTFVTPRARAILRTSSCLPLNANAEVRAITLKSRDLRQEVDDLLGQAVAEILVLLVAAHVLEREDRNRWLRVARVRPTCLRARPSPRASTEIADRLAWPGIAARSARGAGGAARGGGSSRKTALTTLRGRVAAKGARAGEHLVEDCAETEHVRARVERFALALAPATCTRPCPRRCPQSCA